MGNTDLSDELITSLNTFNSSQSSFILSINNIASLVAKLQSTIDNVTSRERSIIQQQASINTRLDIINQREQKVKEVENKLSQQQELIDKQKQEHVQMLKQMELNKSTMTNKIRLNVGML